MSRSDALRQLRRQVGVAAEVATRAVHRRRALRTLPDLADTFPLDYVLHPERDVWSMVSPWERAWARRWARTAYRGEGAIVDLGSYLGATTLALGQGLLDRSGGPPEGRPIHAYDTFRWVDMEGWAAGTPLESAYREGASFRPLFERRIETVRSSVEVHEGDVCELGWPVDAPIELLFNDVSKTPEVWNAVRRGFLPAVEAGGTVVQQDFCHGAAPWLHLFHHRWRDHLGFVEAVRFSSSVVFRVDRPLPAEAIVDDVDYAAWSPGEVDAAYTWAESLVHPEARADVRAAKVMWWAFQGDYDRAVHDVLVAERDGLLRGEVLTFAVPRLVERMAANGLV